MWDDPNRHLAPLARNPKTSNGYMKITTLEMSTGDKMVTSENPGPVVQSIVSLMSLLRGQLVKCFMTL